MTALVTENLTLVSEAPDGIGATRSLILELAVSGALLQQDDGEEHAAELLTRIEEAKRNLGIQPTKRTNRETSPPTIPSGWVFTSFEAVALEVSTGPFGSLIHQSDYVRGGVPLINPSHMIDGHIVADPDVALPPERAAELGAYRLATGDVVMARRGEVGRVALVTEAEDGWLCGTGSFRLRFTDDVSRAYVRLIFRCPSSRRYLAGAAVGMTMVNLNHGVLSRMPVLLPPLPEQHRIVAKVDELMALCDRLDARQQNAEAAHAQLVQALLDSLTQARDADDFRASWQRLAGQFHMLFTTDASVEALKKAIMQLGVQGRLCGGAPRSAWVTGLIESFCTVQGGIQKTPLRAPALHHFPYLRVANVQRGRIDVTELERYELSPGELARWRLHAGDLLIVEGNGSENEIGRCAIWEGQVADCVYQNHLMRVRPTHGDSVEYLALYLNSPAGTAHMRRLAITTSGLFNLSVGKIRSIPVELPPPADQARIVEKVTELLAFCTRLKARIAAARAMHAQVAEVLVAQVVTA